MTRGQEEISTSQVRCMRGSNQELPSSSSLVSSISTEELRSFYQIFDSIGLELSDGLAASIVGEADSVVYLTRE